MFGSKYRLGARIGAGGMAEVFRAERVGTAGFERPVAIKRVRPQWSAHPRYAEMFIHEARIMAALCHPNVVAVSDFARDAEDDLFLVMELVEGITLMRLVQTGPVPVPVVIYLATELLRGLGHLHDRVDADGKPLGLVHRDLSPNNVLLSWDGAVKLSDFGIAKAYAGNGVGVSECYGTPGYVSPEQLRGGTLDGRSDLFVVGVLLYELLTGRRLFVGEDRLQLELAVLRQRIDPLSALRPQIPADLDALVMRLLARERERRPESAEAVIEVLDRCEGASHLGRKELIALLRARCPGSGAQSPQVAKAAQMKARIDRDSEALRKTEPMPVRAQAPASLEPVQAAADASRAVAAAAPGQAPSPARIEQLFQQLPPAAFAAAPAESAPAALQAQAPSPPGLPIEQGAVTTRTARPWAWAAALLLLLGSVAGSMLLRRDASSAHQSETTQAAVCIEGPRATTAPRHARATEPPGEPAPARPVTITLAPAGAAPARLTPDPEVLPSRPDAPATLDFFVKETRP